VAKGVNRLRQRFFGDATDQLDGVIFHNELCGTPQRPCPKAERGIVISGKLVPPLVSIRCQTWQARLSSGIGMPRKSVHSRVNFLDSSALPLIKFPPIWDT
jgi:hypothetical protein